MARSRNNFKPRRSRRSGLKKARLIKSNLEVLKKIIGILLIGMFMSCGNVRYVYVDPKDSVVKRQRVFYNDYYSPFMYNRFYNWNQRPVIIYSRPGFGPLPPTPKPHR